MSVALDASYRWAIRKARSEAKNFYYSFRLLDPARRKAMCAIYAFYRLCDDLSDEPGEKSPDAFRRWRAETDAALGGRFSGHPLWPAFHDAVTHYRIPHEYFHIMIDGVASDAEFRNPQTFDELYSYCYRVASVVGLTVIHVLGFQDEDALRLAEKCGVAFQLTNILRDVKEDFTKGRIYLPAEDLRKFDVADSMLGASAVTEPLRRLLEFEGARARRYYEESARLIGMVHPEGRPMLSALIEIYRTLLRKIEAERYEVLAQRVALPAAMKIWILVKTAANRKALLK